MYLRYAPAVQHDQPEELEADFTPGDETAFNQHLGWSHLTKPVEHEVDHFPDRGDQELEVVRSRKSSRVVVLVEVANVVWPVSPTMPFRTLPGPSI